MWPLFVGIYGIASLVTFAAFWIDKRASRLGRWRVPEMTLHLLELLGGFPGAVLGQHLLRHKSAKLQYRLVLWLIIALHAAAWGAVGWRAWS